MDMLDLNLSSTALQQEWFGCGMDFAIANWTEWVVPEAPCAPQQKTVRFTHPVVSECRYRPRETLEESRRLFFTEQEMAAMRRKCRESILSDELEELHQMGVSNPKFETIADPEDNSVKIMFAVPKRRRRRSSSF